MKYLNQLEPNSLISHFLQHPPYDFNAWLTCEQVPLFDATFDLLTTAEDDFKAKLDKIPGKKWWHKLIKIKTLFVGTTVSEYALFNAEITPDKFVESLKQEYASKYPLIVVKDIPYESPLQSDFANQYDQQMITALKQQGFIELEGQALAWVAIDFVDIDDYMSRLSYKRRKNFRRKLKSRQNITIDVVHCGDDCFFDEETLKQYYQLYLNVFAQSEIHFDKLSEDFFKALLQDKTTNSVIVTYRHDGKLIGYNICFIENNALVDKYIGFDYPAAREFNLYYISWFYNLEYALQHGLKRYIAGWTDPKVKADLGATFTFTKQLVYIRNPLLRAILKRLSSHFESDRQHLTNK